MRKIYMLGIGGISMSALSMIMASSGNLVAGYDHQKSEITKELEKNGVKIDYTLNKKKIFESDLIVCSSAIKDGNPELDFAKLIKKKIITRGQLLGEISDGYEKVVAISGSHGKTTTTAMIYQILKIAGKSPTLHLGGIKCDDLKNYDIGEKEFFVTEACEYCDNFLNLHPYISVVTNIEREHLDYFKTFENQLKSFEKFKNQSQIVVEQNDEYFAKNIRHKKTGELCFSIYKNKNKLLSLEMQICEEINTQNCIFAYRVAKILKVPDCIIKLGLESFKGVKTRFEKMRSSYFDAVVCDYAHHPTEISKAIDSAKKIYKGRKLITVFQPHTFSRTKFLIDDFCKVFESVDYPIFYKTYSAREKKNAGLTGKQLAELIKKSNANAEYCDNYDELKKCLQKFSKAKVVLLFVGAGDLPMILHKNKFVT